MKRFLSVLVLVGLLGFQLQAQDTLRTFTFASDDMTGITYGSSGALTSTDMIGGEYTDAHAYTYTYSYWNRIADSAALYGEGFSTNYPYTHSWGMESYFSNNLPGYNNGFMLATMLDYNWDHGTTVQSQRFNVYLGFPAVSIPATTQVVEVAWRQIYRKYYDQCFVDYKVAGQWQTMEVNVTGIDVDVNSWGSLDAHYTLPLAAAQESSLELRLRYYSYGRGSAYGYFWAVDDFTVISGNPNQWQVTPEHFVDGKYDVIPQGMQIPLTWYNAVWNTGAVTQTGINVSMQHTSPTGATSIFINEDMTPLTNHGGYDTLVVDPRGFYNNANTDWVINGPNYGQSSFATVGNNGLPTTAEGLNTVQTILSSDSLTHTYAEHTYTVSTADDTGCYAWGYGNGVLAGGMEGFRWGHTNNGYITDNSNYSSQPNYQVMALLTTGNTLPVATDGQPWVFRGLEMVVAPTCEYIEGTSITPVLWKWAHNDEDGTYSIGVATGVTEYIVGDEDYTTLENGYMLPGAEGYNTLRIMFPNQPVLEPNTAYHIGYRLNDYSDFALAVNRNSYNTDNDSIARFLNDSILAPYANVFPLGKGDVMAYDGQSWIYSGWNIDQTPMLRALVGPAVEMPKAVVSMNVATGAGIYSMASGKYFYGTGADTVVIGSSATYEVYPTGGYLIDDIYVDGTPIQWYDDYEEYQDTWNITDSMGNVIGSYLYNYYRFTLYEVDENHTVTVTTTPVSQHSVTFNCPDSHAIVHAYINGSEPASPCGTQSYYASEIEYYFELESGYMIDSLTVDGMLVDLGGGLNYTLWMDDTNHTLSLSVRAIDCDIDEFPYTCGFETNDHVLDCWTLTDEGWMLDFYDSDLTHSGNGMMISLSAYYDENTGNIVSFSIDNWLISPAIVIPTGQATNLEWFAASFIGSENYSVYISTTGTDTADFTLLGTYNVYGDYGDNIEYYMQNIDLTAYAGQTVHIAFRHTGGDYVLFLDDLSVEVGNAVSIACSGNGNGLVYRTDNYSSSLCGTTEMIETGFLASYDFIPTNGSELTHLYVNNVDHMADVVTHTSGTSVTVHTYSFAVSGVTTIEAEFSFDCPVTSLPYHMSFEDGDHVEQCWTILNDSLNNDFNWQRFNYNPDLAHSGNGMMISFSGYYNESTGNIVSLSTDNWLVSPTIEIPTGQATNLEWFAASFMGSENYSVYISTSGTDTADFTLLGDYSVYGYSDGYWANYNMYDIDLSAYAGQTIHIAFRHTGGQYVLFLDDVSILSGNQVTVNCTGNGNGATYYAGDRYNNRCYTSELYPSDFLASYDFIPDDGCELAHLYVNDVDRINDVVTHSSGTSVSFYTYSFTVTEDTELEPVFNYPSYEVTFNCSGTGHGRVYNTDHWSGNLCGEIDEVRQGFYASYEFYPYHHSELTHLYVNNVDRIGDATAHSYGSWSSTADYWTYGFTVDSATTVEPVFTALPITITATSNDASMGMVTGGGIYYYDSTVTLTATPMPHYELLHWLIIYESDTLLFNQALIDSIGIDYELNPLVFPANDDLEVIGVFGPEHYTITAAPNNVLYGSVEGGGTFEYLAPVTVSATAYSGYHFMMWSNGDNHNPYTFPATENLDLTAIFVSDDDTSSYFYVTVTVNDVTMGEADGGGIYSMGDTATLTATPFEGYSFVQWNDGNTDNPRLVIVTSNAEYIAYFAAGTGIGDVEGDPVKVYSWSDCIYVAGAEGRTVRVFDVSGRQLTHMDNAAGTLVFNIQHTGVYVVTVDRTAYRVLIK